MLLALDKTRFEVVVIGYGIKALLATLVIFRNYYYSLLITLSINNACLVLSQSLCVLCSLLYSRRTYSVLNFIT